MKDRICISCGELISEHILCSHDKVTRYCPGGPGLSKEQELQTIRELLAIFETEDFQENLVSNLKKFNS